jgi:4-diphosphocytidyl-2-C-methyl-D-erythritol kinase
LPDGGSARPSAVTVRAPAKINLHLSVGPARSDGYHALTTVYQAVSLYDEITASRARGLSSAVAGEGAREVPGGQGNLAVRAARLLAKRTGTIAKARLQIIKRIPVAAGLAGGSADAAGALVACDALWDVGLEKADLLALAAELGSDVPFSLSGGTALGTGRGEQLSPVLARGQYHWVLAFADGGLSTPEVYAEYDRLVLERPRLAVPPDAVLAALRAGDPVQLGRALHNDLQDAALRLRPDLRRVLDTGAELGALAGLVSGSGPTCALLAKSAADSVDLAARLAGAGVCRKIARATGPVSGVRIVPSPPGDAENADAGGNDRLSGRR